MMCRTLIAAHTGCGVHPDNTMASFYEAIAVGAHIAEVDVHASMDGTAILLHDDSPYLREYSYEQLKEPEMRVLLDPIYADFELATLEQVLRASDSERLLLNLDIKSEEAIEPTVRLVREREAQSRVFITGHDLLAEHFPTIKVMLNTPTNLTEAESEQYDEFAERICQQALQGGYVGLNMHFSTCRRQVVDLAHASGLLVWVYTVNELEAMEALIRMDVDAITTRRPERLHNLCKDILEL
ncbi:glycerophosphodiester phosphodiesterase [Paenibacillus sp. OV219]|uniref:glycerophosphodiester phosphodiesterase n=1 Tax=Paenibacillus sp. OV219 TaxID=1884377 RepID=UPI000B88A557|nr:glycerophosphodiester phosphodiesterase [Paenibacillus sp. OV219]